MKPIKVLLIAGASASGKDTMADKLIANNMKYKRSRQVTTRPNRGGETNYDFLTNSEYDTVASGLTCKTTVGVNKYGTRLSSIEGGETINIIIVNENGIKDGRELFTVEAGYELMVLGIRADKNVLLDSMDPNDSERRSRDIDAEYKVYDYCDVTLRRDYAEYEFANSIVSNFFH